MTGKDVSREHFQPRTCSGKKEDFKKIVFIDVDSDQVDEVVIIDYPEFMSKSHGSGAPSRDRVFTPQSVISIDDDDDDESDDAEIPGVVAGSVGELDSDASSSKSSSPDSSKRSSPDSSGVRDSIHIDVDESGVCEKESECDGLKNRKAGPAAEGTGRNRYGLDGSESESSDSDCSDCELMDREQWEKISVKRKRTGFDDQPCYDEHASSSGLHFNKNVCIDIDEENRSGENAGGTTHFGPTDGKYVEKNQSSSFAKVDRQVGNSLKDSYRKAEWETFKSSLFEFTEEEMQSLHRSCKIGHGKSTRSKDFSPCTQFDSYDCCSDVTGVSRFKKEFGNEEIGLLNLSQEADKSQVTNSGSTLKSKNDSLFDLNSKCASVDERHVSCDGPALNEDHCGLTSTTSNERNIINEREKLKETDEYKQAMEEEWASRQLQLQIQAEEVQMLRKRRKAEKRLLDMQRRQKERIEEVRESQKKDEEFMNLKEQLRVDIRKGLNHLEMQCHDMTSLLRGLGIHVGGSFTPLPNEVQAAYKRALFTFHPDRASKSDVRAQVEAEEKFKLISRLKDKFLLTSCH
ncbi:hypothetical protein PHAVU_003G038600 [Phaseolus vulgaris]|uniref:J domain-containing protein n=1 Tax=Phaseolus vulgaris TaxID=3885 RepID=V7C7V7_PHAVU|nr:hypothetical protein PHAVU_003G038600g [Phaseolus vulgaris]ESW25468.1 hypothetical protein PHAVU_003G038600g [Phaseolus vulgaris]